MCVQVMIPAMLTYRLNVLLKTGQDKSTEPSGHGNGCVAHVISISPINVHFVEVNGYEEHDTSTVDGNVRCCHGRLGNSCRTNYRF